MDPTANRPLKPFEELLDLAGSRLGGRAIACSDDFFAPMDNLVKPERAVFIEGKYTDRGKWMDGWESRRKRAPGHDWCILRLGVPGIVKGVNVDTAFFRGNFPEACSLDACTWNTGGEPDAAAPWTEILPRTSLQGNSENLFEINNPHRWTHVRLNIFPDGGVARLRVHGVIVPNVAALAAQPEVDLAAAVNGAMVVAANDMFFGSRNNLIMPGPALNMGDGWETRRKRGLTWHDNRPVEHDWCIVKLAARGNVLRVEIDTSHFKGNFPESCEVQGCDESGNAGSHGVTESRSHEVGASLHDGAAWTTVVPRATLRADTVHTFEVAPDGRPLTHIRLKIYPDGGIARLRVWGGVSA